MKKLIEISKFTWQILKILLGISILILSLYYTQQITKINYINLFNCITNGFIAVFAGYALLTWKKELSQKRIYDIIDEILKNLIKAQNLLKVDFPRAHLNLKDVSGKLVTEQTIHKEIVEIGFNLNFLSSKIRTIKCKNLSSNRLGDLSVCFKQYVYVNGDKLVPFYDAYSSNSENFKTKLDKEIKEIRHICENIII